MTGWYTFHQTGDVTEGTDGEDTPTEARNRRKRLQLLAGAAADRCVRKELAAVRKLLARDATASELDEFYVEHSRFMSEVLSIPLATATEHCQQHRAALNNGTRESFMGELEYLGAAKLALLATETAQ